VDQRVDLDLLRLAKGIDVVEQRIKLVDGRDRVALPAVLGPARERPAELLDRGRQRV